MCRLPDTQSLRRWQRWRYRSCCDVRPPSIAYNPGRRRGAPGPDSFREPHEVFRQELPERDRVWRLVPFEWIRTLPISDCQLPIVNLRNASACRDFDYSGDGTNSTHDKTDAYRTMAEFIHDRVE